MESYGRRRRRDATDDDPQAVATQDGLEDDDDDEEEGQIHGIYEASCGQGDSVDGIILFGCIGD